MIAVREFDNGADVLAHAREVARSRYAPRRIIPTRVVATAEHTAFNAVVPAQTPEPQMGSGSTSGDVAALSAEVVAVMPVPTVEEIIASFRLAHSTEPDDVVTLRELIQRVSDVFGIPLNEMRSARRATDLVNARHAFFFLARRLTDRSFPQIGRYCGGRDHTTVIHGVTRCERLMRENESFRARISAVSSHFAGRVVQ